MTFQSQIVKAKHCPCVKIPSIWILLKYCLALDNKLLFLWLSAK